MAAVSALCLTPKQFGGYVGAVRPALVRYARRRGVSRERAEDVVQDAVVAALESLHRFDGSSGVDGAARWLHAIRFLSTFHPTNFSTTPPASRWSSRFRPTPPSARTPSSCR